MEADAVVNSNSVEPISTGMKSILKIDIMGLNSPSPSNMEDADSTPHPNTANIMRIVLFLNQAYKFIYRIKKGILSYT